MCSLVVESLEMVCMFSGSIKSLELVCVSSVSAESRIGLYVLW